MDQMARWGWLIPTVAVVALAAVVLLKGPAAAPSAAITELGTGTVQVAPDTAVIQLGVMSTGANAQSAVTHNDTLMAAVEQAIEQHLGVPASALQVWPLGWMVIWKAMR